MPFPLPSSDQVFQQMYEVARNLIVGVTTGLISWRLTKRLEAVKVIQGQASRRPILKKEFDLRVNFQ